MDVPFGCNESDFKGACTRFNNLIQRICGQIVTDAGVVYADTYSNRANYPAEKYLNSVFVAIDQDVVYQSQKINGKAQWAYASGIIYGTTSANGNLVPGDAGVLLLTSSAPVKLYRWSGSAWVDVSPSSGVGQSTSNAFTLLDTHANRLAHYPAANYPVGTQFFETSPTFSDRQATYVIQSVSGTKTWVYQGGVYVASYASRPADLTSSDVGFRFNDTTYMHTWLWSGASWGYAPGDPGSQFIVMSPSAPPGGVWYPCDGTAHTCTTATGGTTSITPPNYNGTIAAIFGGGTDATVKAGAVPTWQAGAKTDDESTHTHATDLTPLFTLVTPSGSTHVVSSGSYASGAGQAHHHGLSNANALLNIPSEANGGLSAHFKVLFWLRA